MTAPTPRLLDAEHRLLVVGIVALVTVVATEAMAVSTVMPVVEDELGDLWLYGWVFSGFYLGTLVGVVVGGSAVDRVAPLGPMLAGVTIFVTGLAVGGLAPSMPVLVVGRVLQGLGAGAVPVVSYVCISRGFPAVLRPKAFAAMSTAWVVPSLVSPLVAAEVAAGVGWRWVFLGLIPVTLLVASFALPALRTVPGPDAAGDVEGGPQSRRAAPASVALLVVGVAAVLGGLGSDVVWVGVPIAVVGAAVAFGPFRRLTPEGTLRAARGLPAAVLTRGVLTFAFFSADAFVSLALTSVRDTSTRFAGAVLATASLTWTVGSWTQARLSEAWGSARLVRTGGSLVATGCTLLAVSLSGAVPLPVWFLAAACKGLGMGMAYPQLSVVTLAEAPAGQEGAATSALQMTDMLGIVLGTGFAGVVVSVGDRVASGAWVALAIVFGLAATAGTTVALLGQRLPGRRAALR